MNEPLIPSPRPRQARRAALTLAAAAAAVGACTLALTAGGPLVGFAALATARRGRTVLITGFQPFGNLTSNPAEQVATLLNGTCDQSVCIESWSLPVDHVGVEAPARQLEAGSHRWDAVIHLGFESVAKGLRIETAAANVAASDAAAAWSADVPCNKSGTQWRDVHHGAPCLLATTAPLDALALPLLRPVGAPAVAPELWSRDAGVYFCNEIYYRTLTAVRANLIAPSSVHGSGLTRRLLPALFIHLPPPNTSGIVESAAFVRAVAEQVALV